MDAQLNSTSYETTLYWDEEPGIRFARQGQTRRPGHALGHLPIDHKYPECQTEFDARSTSSHQFADLHNVLLYRAITSMSLLSRLMGLWGLAKRPGMTAPMPSTKALAPAHACTPVASPRQAEVLLHREEMLDRQGRLAGYRLSDDASGRAQAASCQRYLDALKVSNARQQAERRLTVIEVHLDGYNHEEWTPLLGPYTVIHIRLPLDQSPTATQLDTLKHLSASGVRTALSWSEAEGAWASALPCTSLCFVDFASMTVQQFEACVSQLHSSYPSLQLAIENVGSWPERRLCVSLGTAFTLGRFLTTIDEDASQNKVTDSRVVLMDMLNLVRSEGDTCALAETAKRDPGIAVHILSMANSAAYGCNRVLTSLDQAISVLGRDVLYRWLAISVFRLGSHREHDKALLELALSRAKFLELMARTDGATQQSDELFLVGLLSFIDALLGMPLKEVLTKMSLPPSVNDVLMRNEGPYAPYLLLALAVEKCQFQRIEQLAAMQHIDSQNISSWRNTATLWAEQAAQ